ncbi:MAG: Holliday junction branch migration DNA helicase RuvB, partial [Planctomycetota bacterium]|nr:Holliday junction branch migration DNA helicase RuvB [Planctomycetota bacterium]
KTTLSYLVAKELQTNIKVIQGPSLERPADLAGILSNLENRSVLFIDEIHRIPVVVSEYLYSAMEDFKLNIMIDQGPHARAFQLNIAPFTLIGATTREGLLTDAFRSRFGIFEKLELYPKEDLLKIIKRSARLLAVNGDEEALKTIAQRSRGTPRIANQILKRIRDVAQVKSNNYITKEIAEEGFQMLGIDQYGLVSTDRKILQTIIANGGGPVGLKTISISVGEEEDTIEDVYEPYLVQRGFLEKTPRGRKVTPQAYEHLQRIACSERSESEGKIKEHRLF